MPAIDDHGALTAGVFAPWPSNAGGNSLRRFLIIAVAPMLLAATLSACGGGTSSAKKTETAATGGSPGATTTAARGTTPSSDKTVLHGTPSPASAGATGTTGTPPASIATPAASGGTVVESGQPRQPSPLEVTLAAQLNDPTIAAGVPDGGGITGGNPGDPRRIVVPVPAVTPDPGTTPVADSTNIAPPSPPSGDVAVIVDADASADGVQATRTVHVGDVIRVGVVIANVPSDEGVSAFNFTLTYDKTKIVAPTISGGASSDRNPDLNVDALGGVGANWTCLPAPEGDLDDPGGLPGDGNPATGQALLSCFSVSAGHGSSGSIVLATIEFHVIGKGATELKLSNLVVGDSSGTQFASCDADPGPQVSCPSATITVN